LMQALTVCFITRSPVVEVVAVDYYRNLKLRDAGLSHTYSPNHIKQRSDH